MDLSKDSFEIFLESINKCYSINCASKLPQTKDFPDEIFDENEKLNKDILLNYAEKQRNVYFSSVSKRIVAILNIIYARETKTDLDLKTNWSLIYSSILTIPIEDTVSSIGSQGFLSIPLYRYDKGRKDLDFIRLHIWDDSLYEHINKGTCNLFSIHTHSFYGRSWVIAGKIGNNRYTVAEMAKPTNHSLFVIKYNESLNLVNQHTSTAENIGKYVSVTGVSEEIYKPGESYQINVGEYHQSTCYSDDGLSATFFSFTAKDGLVSQSYVVGPSTLRSSIINRKMHIDPTELLFKIEKKIGHGKRC